MSRIKKIVLSSLLTTFISLLIYNFFTHGISSSVSSFVSTVKLYCLGDNSYKVFAMEMIKHPKYIGALTPSSKDLSFAITSYVSLGNTILEVGAGAGTFTEYLTAKTSKDKLFIVEFNENFCQILKTKFPGYNIINTDATSL